MRSADLSHLPPLFILFVLCLAGSAAQAPLKLDPLDLFASGKMSAFMSLSDDLLRGVTLVLP